MNITKAAINHLRRARTRLSKGWTQGVWYRDRYTKEPINSPTKDCLVCLTGSIFATAEENQPLVLQEAMNAIRANQHMCVSWNDLPGRKQGEVVNLLTKAINTLRRREHQDRKASQA